MTSPAQTDLQLLEEELLERLGDKPPAANRLIVLVVTCEGKLEVALDMEGELGTEWARYATVRAAVSGYALFYEAVAAAALYVSAPGSGAFAADETPVSIALASDDEIYQTAFPFGRPEERVTFDQLAAVLAVELKIGIIANGFANKLSPLEPDSTQVNSLYAAPSATAARSLFAADSSCQIAVASESADGEIESWKIKSDDREAIFFDLPQRLRRTGSISATIAAADMNLQMKSLSSRRGDEPCYLLCSPDDRLSLGAIEISGDDWDDRHAYATLAGSMNDSLLAGVGFASHPVAFTLGKAIDALAASLAEDEEKELMAFAMVGAIYEHYTVMKDLVPLGEEIRESVQEWQMWVSASKKINPSFFNY